MQYRGEGRMTSGACATARLRCATARLACVMTRLTCATARLTCATARLACVYCRTQTFRVNYGSDPNVFGRSLRHDIVMVLQWSWHDRHKEHGMTVTQTR